MLKRIFHWPSKTPSRTEEPKETATEQVAEATFKLAESKMPTPDQPRIAVRGDYGLPTVDSERLRAEENSDLV